MTVAVTTAAPARDFHYFPPPTHAPAPDPAYPHDEFSEIAAVALMMGLVLMPWQRFVIELATAYRLDAFGRRIYRFSKVLITVPRQSGKTTLMTPVRLHRIMTRQGIDAFSTAQTGKDAGKRIRKMIEVVMASPLASLFTKRESNGSEGLRCKKTGSSLTRFSPTVGALHGETPFFVDFDEIWKYTEFIGDQLIGAASPGGITLGGQLQIWMISTKGTAQSTFMNKWMAHGINGTEAGLGFFEWSMPDGMDPDEPATWWSFHPALGNTITEEDLRKEMYAEGMTRAERLRAYMNRLTEAENPIIEPEDWQALAAPVARPDFKSVAIAFEVAPDNELSAVVAGWRDTQGNPHTVVLHQALGTGWLPGYLATVAPAFAVLAADDGGPNRRITAALIKDGQEVLTPTMPQRGAADMAWLDAARDSKTLVHDHSRPLTSAVAVAVPRTTNGVTTISRDHSTGPVAAVIASSVALWAWDNRPPDTDLQIFG